MATPFVAASALLAAWLTFQTHRFGIWIATGIMSASMLTYQPAAMTYWAGVIAIALTQIKEPIRRFTLRAVFVGAGSSLVSFVAVKIGAALTDTTRASRANLELDPVGKAGWLLTDALPRALDPLSLRPFPVVAWIIGLLLAAGLWQLDRVAVPLAIAAVLLSYLPNLLIDDERPAARTMTGLMPTIVILASVAIARLEVRRMLPTLHRRLDLLVSSAIALALVLAASNVIVFFSIPQARELEIAREATRAIGPAKQIYVRNSALYRPLAPNVVYDEFGMPSTSLPYLAEAITALVHAEEFGTMPQVQAREHGGALPTPAIDYRALLASQSTVDIRQTE